MLDHTRCLGMHDAQAHAVLERVRCSSARGARARAVLERTRCSGVHGARAHMGVRARVGAWTCPSNQKIQLAL